MRKNAMKFKETTEKKLYLSIERSAKLIREKFNSILHNSDLNISFEQWLVLRAIAENPGVIQKDVAENLSKEPASISRMLKKLQTKNLVQFKKDVEDKKSNRLYLAPDGYEFIKQGSRLMDKGFKGFFGNMHEKEMHLLIDIMKRLKN